MYFIQKKQNYNHGGVICLKIHMARAIRGPGASFAGNTEQYG